MDLATKVSKKISMPGYIINPDILHKIDEIAINTIRTEKDSEIEVFYSLRDDDNERHFKKISDVDHICENVENKISSVTLKYEIMNQAGLTISFQDDGCVELSGYSNSVDFDYRIDQISRELKRCEQDYNWLESNFAISDTPKRLLLKSIIILFLALVVCFIYVLYAKNVGVDISDIGIIPDGNAYFNEVEASIKSDDVDKKLNTLLVGQLRNFSNVTDIISKTSSYIKYISVTLIIVLILFFVVQSISKIYPLTFFEFGNEVKNLEKIKRKREIWGIVVILGFIVNITAGLLVAMLI